ncbi:IS3 family transposase, partial [Pseudomonas aeruginosa]
LDLHTRRVIGWAFSAKPDAELVIKALDMAYEQRGRPQQVLFHNWIRPHQFNDGLPPAVAEEKLNPLSGMG